MLLLSDKSQTVGQTTFPKEAVPVDMTEIVRSSKRIAAGASAFQLDTRQKRYSCSHDTEGPPLKTFIFEVGADDDRKRWPMPNWVHIPIYQITDVMFEKS